MVVNGCQCGPAFQAEEVSLHYHTECQNIQPLFAIFNNAYRSNRFMPATQAKRMVAESLNERRG